RWRTSGGPLSGFAMAGPHGAVWLNLLNPQLRYEPTAALEAELYSIGVEIARLRRQRNFGRRGGRKWVHRPNAIRLRLMSAMGGKRTLAVGNIGTINNALLPLGDDVTLETQFPVVIIGDAVCGSITQQEVLAGTLRVHKQVLAPETAKPLLGRVADAISAVFD